MLETLRRKLADLKIEEHRGRIAGLASAAVRARRWDSRRRNEGRISDSWRALLRRTTTAGYAPKRTLSAAIFIAGKRRNYKQRALRGRSVVLANFSVQIGNQGSLENIGNEASVHRQRVAHCIQSNWRTS